MINMFYKILDLWAQLKDRVRRMVSPPPKLSAEEQRERNEMIAAFSADAAKHGRPAPGAFRAEFVESLVKTHGDPAIAKALADSRNGKRNRKNRASVPTP